MTDSDAVKCALNAFGVGHVHIFGIQPSFAEALRDVLRFLINEQILPPARAVNLILKHYSNLGIQGRITWELFQSIADVCFEFLPEEKVCTGNTPNPANSST